MRLWGSAGMEAGVVLLCNEEWESEGLSLIRLLHRSKIPNGGEGRWAL